METKEQILTNLRQIKAYLNIEYAVNTIGLFGSFADDTQSANSDVDILISFSKPIGWKMYALENFISKNIGRKIDLVTVKGLKPAMKEAILNKVIFV